MKNILKLLAVGMLVAAQPVFALPPPPTHRVPDAGATALLALVSISGLVIGKNLMKKR